MVAITLRVAYECGLHEAVTSSTRTLGYRCKRNLAALGMEGSFFRQKVVLSTDPNVPAQEAGGNCD